MDTKVTIKIKLPNILTINFVGYLCINQNNKNMRITIFTKLKQLSFTFGLGKWMSHITSQCSDYAVEYSTGLIVVEIPEIDADQLFEIC